LQAGINSLRTPSSSPRLPTSGVTGVDAPPSGNRVCVTPRASLLWKPAP